MAKAPKDKSIAELEREIEASRARLDHTIDRIQDRLSVAGMVDELVGSAGDAPLSGLFERTLATVRRNPVPLMLAAVGVGLLLQHFNQKRRDEAAAYRPTRRRASEVEEDIAPILAEPRAKTYDPDEPAGQPRRDTLDARGDDDARA